MTHSRDTFIKELWALTNRAKRMHKDERELTLESVDIIGKISSLNPWQHMNMSQELYLKYIGLTVSRYSKRRRVFILFKMYPKARAMFEQGEAEISHLVAIARRITKANADIMLEGIKGKSKREVEEFAARVQPDGTIDHESTIHDILLRADEDLLQLFNRAREVMAHGGSCPKNADIVRTALESYLKKHDPMQKAERWRKRVESSGKRAEVDAISEIADPAPAPPTERDETPSTIVSTPGPAKRWGQFTRQPIPAAIRHRVWLRDGGRCTYISHEGTRCRETMMIELDHIIMVCRGGDNSESNLRLRCRAHNKLTADIQLGRSG